MFTLLSMFLFNICLSLILNIGLALYSYIAQIGGMLPQDLIVLIAPVIVYLSTATVNYLKHLTGNGGFGGTILTTLIVPLLSLLAAWIVSLVAPQSNFWITFAIGIAGTYINELLKQWKQTLQQTQTTANKPFIG